MRYSTDLCDEENDFRQKRKTVVFEAMKKLLGERGPKTLDEVNRASWSVNCNQMSFMDSLLKTTFRILIVQSENSAST